MLYSPEIQLISPKQRWQRLSHPLLVQHRIQLWVCHLDTLVPEVSGNKWLKLKYHVQQVMQQNCSGILTFGGAFSNHLCAVAACCRLLGLQSAAYVRADDLDMANPTLAFCQQAGMQLYALDRTSYRQRDNPDFIQQLQEKHKTLLMVPEGGSSDAGASGIAELNLATTPEGDADIIICPTASGGTLAGVINRHDCAALGIAVVKDTSLPQRVSQLLTPESRTKHWQINTNFVGKGYGKFDEALLSFCREMAQHQLHVEPIYTGKTLAAVFSLIASGDIPENSRLSVFHTGGLQGLKGLHYRGLITVSDLALLSGSVAG
ncbi:pyridoxal-phosphate dependent enzyme [Rheinheimera baltica]|uniref:Pyridoxal-phosphate dependent enzyme n=1 Tax=Rheinheimera baltica TaxID=67576 RepID=A0ABT9HWG3_9GAMM|nr:pyridoxal-phosphate dependent enzyme [Rheinheimera baltica]MDP5135318.1 pyridoxal-phosphate dependent enzyme [Rheinheimera baltica]MDP5142589.1 pyridoxal-phosphate dependent enzyme [Rheinheimera baltica]MDP5151898.1 pyridoxal-phosphate dependent enzyme [Rheinheimera baltica]